MGIDRCVSGTGLRANAMTDGLDDRRRSVVVVRVLLSVTKAAATAVDGVMHVCPLTDCLCVRWSGTKATVCACLTVCGSASSRSADKICCSVGFPRSPSLLILIGHEAAARDAVTCSRR